VKDGRAAVLLGAAFAAALALFRGWPDVDLAASAPFHDAVLGTWAGASPPAEALREALWTSTEVAAAVFALALLVSLARRGRAAVPARVWGFGLAALALGPGLLVNGLLKAQWHRPRPRTVAEFGGEADFTPAWQVAGDCARNCSFVSGEAAAILTLALVLWLIGGRRLSGAARPIAALVLVAAVLAASGLRLAAGGHFLSDVIFAWLLCGTLTLALWRVTGADRAAAHVTPADIRADLTAPFAAAFRAIRGLRGNRPRPK
jgi:lipid A 4'-phosphatase